MTVANLRYNAETNLSILHTEHISCHPVGLRFRQGLARTRPNKLLRHAPKVFEYLLLAIV
eukprot:scaffold245450_cov18-Prasinocladus_malaysianus.AAC.1